MEEAARGSKWWIWPAATASLLLAGGLAYLLLPGVDFLVRTAGNVLGSGEPMAVRIFLVTTGGRSPLAAIALIAWQALLMPLADVPVLRVTGMMWGPFWGSLINWVGLVAGATAVFGLGRALIGIPFAHFYPRTKEPLGIARWVVLGLRAIPAVPQDYVSLGAGASRMRFVDYLVPTAIGALPPAVVYAVMGESIPNAGTQSLEWGGLVIGLSILGVLLWRYRGSIPFGTLSAERKRNLIAGIAVIVVSTAAYLLVPSVKAWVDEAVSRIAAGDVRAVRDYLRSFGIWAPVVSAMLMILQSIIAPLPAFVVTFANGLLFGWAWGAALSWSSAMAGAALCFYIARALGRPAVEKLVGGSAAVAWSDRFFERFGERAVLIARLLPFVSFDLMSYGAGLTSMKFWPFFIATGIGQLPATLIYSYLGQNLSGSIRVLFFTFVITIAIFVAVAAARPLFMRWLEQNRDAKSAAADTGDDG